MKKYKLKYYLHSDFLQLKQNNVGLGNTLTANAAAIGNGSKPENAEERIKQERKER